MLDDTETGIVPDEVEVTPDPATEMPEGEFLDQALAPQTDVIPAADTAGIAQSLPVKDVRGAVAAEHESGLAQADAQRRVTEAIAANHLAHETEREIQAGISRDLAFQQRMDEQELRDREEEHQSSVAAAHDELTRAEDAVRDTKFHGFWSSAPAANKVLASLFIAIGGGASVIAKQPNLALEAIKSADEREFRLAQMELMKAEKFVEYKRRDVTDMRTEFDRDLARLRIIQAKRLESTANYAKGELVKRGISPEEAQSNVLVAGLINKADAARTKALTDLYKADQAARARAKRGTSAGNGAGLAKLIEMAEAGEPLSKIAIAANAVGIPAKAYLPAIKDVEGRATRAGKAKASEEQSASETAVMDEDGNVIGNAPTKTVAAAVNKDVAGAHNLRGMLQDLRDLLKRTGGGKNPLGSDYAQIQSLKGAINLAAKDAYQLGVIAGPDMGLIESVTGGTFDTAFPGLTGIDSKLAETQRTIDKGIKAKLASAGVKQGSPKSSTAKVDDATAKKLDDLAGKFGL